MSGVFSDRGVFNPSSGVFSPGGVFSLGGVFDAPSTPPWVDPLANIPFALRLQTHRGDGVPLGLYQDAACTVPATLAGQAVAAWRDELSGSGLIATQSVSTKRPILRFTAGVPWLEFDGVDDYLDVTMPVVGAVSAAMTFTDHDNAVSSRGLVFGRVGVDDYNDERVMIGVRKAGVEYMDTYYKLGSRTGHGLAPANGWNVLTIIKTNTQIHSWMAGTDAKVDNTAGTLDATTVRIGCGILAAGAGDPWKGGYQSILIGSWPMEDIAIVSPYLTSLLP